jgi:hypothetical protein
MVTSRECVTKGIVLINRDAKKGYKVKSGDSII